MRILYDQACPDRRAQTLAIFLPGALQQPEDLIQAGFVEAVRGRGMSMDLALLDFQLKYVGEATDESVLRHLHDEVIQPANLQGYSAIWLVGISIGGFMSLAYAGSCPGNVAGLCLLAPYPGSRIVTNEIREAGGLSQWIAGGEFDDAERRVWQWLQQHQATGNSAVVPEIHFGYALQDRFVRGQQLMADALKGAHIDIVTGTHDWPAWKQLWENFLDRIDLHMKHNAMDTAA